MSYKHFLMAKDYYDEATKAGISLVKYDEYVLWGGIANSLNGLGRDQEAEIIFQKALNLRPALRKWPAYEINIARCMIAQNKLEEAEKRLLDFIKRRAEEFGIDDTDDYLYSTSPTQVSPVAFS